MTVLAFKARKDILLRASVLISNAVHEMFIFFYIFQYANLTHDGEDWIIKGLVVDEFEL